MRRMKVSSYLKAAFVEGEAPDEQSIRRGINNSSIPGEKVGGLYFVYVNDDLSLAIEYLGKEQPKVQTVKPVNAAAARIFDSIGMPR